MKRKRNSKLTWMTALCLEVITSWHWNIQFKTWFIKIAKTVFKWQRLICISSTWNNIVFSSKSIFRFFWVYLGLFKFLEVVYLFYMGLIGVQTVNIIFMTSVVRVFENLEKKFKLKVSLFSFWAIEPIRKGGNDKKFRKPHFSGKLMNRVLFSWV